MKDEEVMHAMNLDDAYRVERVLASGAGGVTELVTLGGAGPFVRKKVPLALANQSVWAAIASLDCARVPRVQATYSLPDVFVVIYDYVPGQTLQELVLASGRLGATKAAKLAMDICEAADALHSRGVIHRDLSPRNVIVAADGAHLIDLGIARTHVDGATADTTFLGTHGFAAPEQYGFAQTDARSDVYAIGCLLGFMLTGKEPDEEGYAEALAALETALDDNGMAGDNDTATGGGTTAAVDAPGACETQRAIETQLAACIRQACAFEPSARFQSAEQMSNAISQALAGETTNSSSPYANSPQARHGVGAEEANDRIGPNGATRTDTSTVSASDATAFSARAIKNGIPGNATSTGNTANIPNANVPSARRPSGTGQPFSDNAPNDPSKKIVAALAIALALALFVIGALLFSKGTATSDGSSADSAVSSSTRGVEADQPDTNTGETDSDQSANATAVDELPLEIAESGWSVTSGGYVNYVVGLRNTSEDTAVDLPIVRATGYSAAGEVLFTGDLGAMVSAPNQTSYLADKTYLDNTNELDHIEFALQTNSATQARSSSDSVAFSASSPTAHDDGLGGTNFTGTLNVNGTESAIANLAPYSSSVCVTIVLRDSSGAIVGGASDYLAALSPGTQPYSVTYTNIPDYATAEAYAQPW